MYATNHISNSVSLCGQFREFAIRYTQAELGSPEPVIYIEWSEGLMNYFAFEDLGNNWSRETYSWECHTLERNSKYSWTRTLTLGCTINAQLAHTVDMNSHDIEISNVSRTHTNASHISVASCKNAVSHC